MFNGISYVVLYNIDFSVMLNFRRLGIMVSPVLITAKLSISPNNVSVQIVIHTFNTS